MANFLLFPGIDKDGCRRILFEALEQQVSLPYLIEQQSLLPSVAGRFKNAEVVEQSSTP